MKFPITVTADGYAQRRPAAVASLALSDVWRFAARHWGLFAAIAITFIVYAPTLRYYFGGDDFVVLGSIEHAGTRQFLADTFLLRDIVPNWRPLTSLIYAAEWQLFGLNAMAWRAVNLAVHLGSVALLYALVTRVTRRPAIGAIAALIFGVSGAHFDTVTYVTALPHVLATFLTLGSLMAIIAYAQDGERDKRAYALSFLLFLAAFLANEGSFVFAPVIAAAYALYARRWHRALHRLPLHAAPYAAVAIGWLAFYQSYDGAGLKFDGFYWGSHVVPNSAVYLSWIVFPAKSIPADPSAVRWAIAAIVAAVGAYYALRGPHIARVGVFGVALALLPYVPVEIWTASRYTYTAVAFAAPVAAIGGYALFEKVRASHPYARVPATIAGVALVAIIAGLYGWQTYAQDARSGRNTDRWQLLVNELRANYADVPDGTTIYIIDGPWTNPMEQYTWVPSVARTVYGDAAAFNLPAEQVRLDPPDTENAVFLQWIWGVGLRRVEPSQVLAGR